MKSTLGTTDRSRPRATTTSVVAALLPIMAGGRRRDPRACAIRFEAARL
jgi:hypothetical protein